MGNQHEIIQVAPFRCHGAALRIREAALERTRKAVLPGNHLYTYVVKEGEPLTIRNLDCADTSLGCQPGAYIAIQSGGKMWCGYDAFLDHLAGIASCLEDGLFFIGDELDFIDRIEIRNGELYRTRVHSGDWLDLAAFLEHNGDPDT